MTNVWYTSDLHIGHRLVSGIRGFMNPAGTFADNGKPEFEPDTQAHDDFMAEMWDMTVKKDDIVYVLGDISINGKAHALDWFRQRPGTIHLISGNHDPVHPAHRGAEKFVRPWLEVFDSVQPFLRKKLEGKNFLLSHFPYAGTGAEGGRDIEDRFTQYRLIDEGLPLLHGHTHGQEKGHLSDAGTPQLHVGLDAWRFRLVPQGTVIDWLNGRPMKSP